MVIGMAMRLGPDEVVLDGLVHLGEQRAEAAHPHRDGRSASTSSVAVPDLLGEVDEDWLSSSGNRPRIRALSPSALRSGLPGGRLQYEMTSVMARPSEVSAASSSARPGRPRRCASESTDPSLGLDQQDHVGRAGGELVAEEVLDATTRRRVAEAAPTTAARRRCRPAPPRRTKASSDDPAGAPVGRPRRYAVKLRRGRFSMREFEPGRSGLRPDDVGHIGSFNGLPRRSPLPDRHRRRVDAHYGGLRLAVPRVGRSAGAPAAPARPRRV